MRALIVVLVGCTSAPPTAWTTEPPLPAPRLEPGVTALADTLVVIGGFDDIGISSRVDVFDPRSGTWSRLPDAPVAYTHLQVATIDATIYLLGGLDGTSFMARGDTYALDTEDLAAGWRALTAMPAGLERGAAAVVVAPPRIYLLGGASTTRALASTLVYDVDTNTWQEHVALPAPRSHPFGMRAGDGTLVVGGGLATLSSNTAAADVWRLVDGAWQPQTSMPTARGGCAAAVVAGALVCAGGERGTAALAVTERYDADADTWTTLDALPEPRAGTGAAAIGDRIYVPGGARRLVIEPTDSVYSLRLVP